MSLGLGRPGLRRVEYQIEIRCPYCGATTVFRTPYRLTALDAICSFCKAYSSDMRVTPVKVEAA